MVILKVFSNTKTVLKEIYACNNIKNKLDCTFWNNYSSEHFWKAASAPYFLYSCKQVYESEFYESALAIQRVALPCKIHLKLVIKKVFQDGFY